jgi:hypothetical protein
MQSNLQSNLIVCLTIARRRHLAASACLMRAQAEEEPARAALLLEAAAHALLRARCAVCYCNTCTPNTYAAVVCKYCKY